MFKKLFSFFRSNTESRSYSPTDDYWYSQYPYLSSTVDVNPLTSMTFLTLAACIQLISGDIAKLPIGLFRKDQNGQTTRLRDNRLDFLISTKPNHDTSSFNFRETLQSAINLSGNAYSLVEWSGDRVKALWQVDEPDKVQVERKNGRLVYTIPGTGKFTRDEILHVAGWGYNGIVGFSPLTLANSNISNALGMQNFSSNFFKKGTHPSAILETSIDMGPAKEQFEKDFKEKYLGLGAKYSVATLPPGITFKPLTMKLVDAQFIEQMNVTKADICAFYGVPMHMVNLFMGNANRSNLEQENQSYIDRCLGRTVLRWEQALNTQLLTDDELMSGMFFKFNLKALLRGDSDARANLYDSLWSKGLPLNRILEIEDMTPVDDGDTSFVQMSYAPAQQLAEGNDRVGSNVPNTTANSSQRTYKKYS